MFLPKHHKIEISAFQKIWYKTFGQNVTKLKKNNPATSVLFTNFHPDWVVPL